MTHEVSNPNNLKKYEKRLGYLSARLPACPASEKGKRPAERFGRRTGPKHLPKGKKKEEKRRRGEEEEKKRRNK